MKTSLRNDICKKQLLNLFISTFLFLVLINPPIFALNTLLPPGSNFDLDPWILQTISIENKFEEKLPPDLRTGYTSNLFYTNTTDGSMVFKVPSNGGTTSGSGYPRVEFRQVKNGAYWSLADTSEHYLTAQCKVITVATAKPQTIFGQIHGNENNSELLKLRWTGYLAKKCYIEARFQTNDSIGSEYGVKLATGLSLGDLISYTITMKNGTITATANGISASQTYSAKYYGTTDTYYFKAGNYFQYSSTDSTIFGLNQFYKLSLIKEDPTSIITPKLYETQIYYNHSTKCIATCYELLSPSKISLIIYDLNGKIVRKLIQNRVENSGIIHHSFEISDLKNGIYWVRYNSDHLTRNIKLIIEN